MKFGSVLLGAVVATALSLSSASATVRIVGDSGGQIGPYLQHLAALRHSGERVVIDGPCLSACTLVLSAVPKDRICVTRRPSLGFHAAWQFGQSGAPVRSAGGTDLLWSAYPTNVRHWISRNGGLRTRMIFLRGRELSAMYHACQ